MPSPNNNHTEHLKFKYIETGGSKVAAEFCSTNNRCIIGTNARADFDVRRATAASFQVTVTDTTGCAAPSVVDECVNLTACNSFTATAHGLYTGTAGTLTACIGAAKLTPAACFSTCTNIITEACHGFTEGERGRFTTSCTLPSFCGCVISACTDYYVVVVSANTYQIATSRANAIAACPTTVCITGAGIGNHTFTPNGDVPCGLTACCTYYAIKTDANTFQLASSAQNAINGTAIELTGTNAPAATVFTATTNVAGSIAFTGSIDGETFYSIPCGPANISLNCVECANVGQIVNTYASGGLGGINVIRLSVTLTAGSVTLDIDAASNATS